jgi:hypothetical protein
VSTPLQQAIECALTDFEEAERRLRAAQFEPLGKLSVGGSSWLSPAGQTIDLLFRREPRWPALIHEAQSNRDVQDFESLVQLGRLEFGEDGQ